MRNINSLKNVSQFKEVYNRGKSLANKYLVLYVLPAEGDLRLGISVSKKVGNSVVRHRMARLIRESFLFYKGQLPDGYHLVVIVRVAAHDKGFKEIKDSFGHLLKQHRLI